MTKPIRTKADDDDLPSVNSHDDDHELWDSDLEEYSGSEDDSEDKSELESDNTGSGKLASSDAEQTYERQPRPKNKLFDKDEIKGSERLPVKLPDGTIRKRGNVPAPAPQERSDSDSSDSGIDASSSVPKNHYGEHAGTVVEDVSTGARFGRPAVVTVISTKSRKARIQGAKEQLAGICQEILADPENSVS